MSLMAQDCSGWHRLAQVSSVTAQDGTGWHLQGIAQTNKQKTCFASGAQQELHTSEQEVSYLTEKLRYLDEGLLLDRKN